MRDWLPLAVVAVLFVTFCTAFNSATPYRKSGILVHQRDKDGGIARIPDVGAPDERQHANYVSGLLRGEGFPVLRPGDPNLGETYQSHQPPAYYLLAAGWCKVFGIDPTSETGGFGLRFLNTLIGLATMLGVYSGAKWFTGNAGVATAAAAFLLLPMSIALHSAASNDPLLFCTCTWVMALIGLALTHGWTWKNALTLGILAGLALLTKTTAIVLLPCIVLALALAWKKETRPSAIAVAASALVPLALALPWWIRNMSLYGDPLAMKAFNAAFVNSPQASVFIDGLGIVPYFTSMVAWWTARSALGVFGYMDIFMFEQLSMDKSNSIYVAILFLVALPIVLGATALFTRTPEGEPSKKPLFVWTAFALLVGLSFVRFNMQYFQGQARYLYPAIGPVAWCGAMGLSKAFRGHSVLTWLVITLFFSVLDVTAYQQIVQGFSLRL